VRKPGDADEAAERARRAAQELLAGGDFKLEDEVARAGGGSGYDPYDTVPNVRQADSAQRHADLRRLSEWIRAKRQAESNHGAGAKPRDPESLADTLPADKPFWPGRR
jgi:hypothetical protein